MIKSFRNKETEKIFNRHFSGKLPQNIQRVARKKLVILDAAPRLNDLRIPPGNQFEVCTKHGCQADTVDTYTLLTKCLNHAFHPING